MKNNELNCDFNNFLEATIKEKNILSTDLKDAMLYSLNSGGKRLRPRLVMITAKIFGSKPDYVYNYAAALEMIHEFSLVHDDLPCMDDDDYRRGVLTTHKAFGETNALLAGDALLNLASEIAFKDILDDYNENKVKAYNLMFINSGSEGMIDGQSFELIANNTIEDYMITITKKTQALFDTSIYGTGLYLGLQCEILSILKELSYYFGIGFQVIDDKNDNDGIYQISKTDAENILFECENKINDIYNTLVDKGFDIFGYKELTDKLFSNDF